MYSYYESGIRNTWGKLLGDRCKVSTINELAKTIEDCVAESIGNHAQSVESSKVMLNEKGEIVW